MAPINYILAALAAIAAGLTNALAGGGTLITFPVLLAIGLPAVSANVTNTVGLCPASSAAHWPNPRIFKARKNVFGPFSPPASWAELVGGYLLLITSEKLFTNLVPFLILIASALLAVQNPVRNWLTRRLERGQSAHPSEYWIFLPVFLGAIYGGYFGAGLSVIMLSVLGLVLNDNLTRLNALKQVIAFAANLTAAVLFAFSGKVYWTIGLVMAVGALLGGVLGGRIAGRIKPSTLRLIVVILGFVVGTIYLVKTYL